MIIHDVDFFFVGRIYLTELIITQRVHIFYSLGTFSASNSLFSILFWLRFFHFILYAMFWNYSLNAGNSQNSKTGDKFQFRFAYFTFIALIIVLIFKKITVLLPSDGGICRSCCTMFLGIISWKQERFDIQRLPGNFKCDFEFHLKVLLQ